MTKYLAGRGAKWLVTIVVLTAVAAQVTGAQAPLAQSQTSSQLTALADSGRFSDLLLLLRADYASLDHAGVADLIEEVERFQQNDQRRAQERRGAYQEAVNKITAELTAGRLEEGLVAAINAHSLTDDPDALLAHPDVKSLVALAKKATREAEQSHDWIEALSLNRALELLFEDQRTYRDHVKRISRHVRVLQLFAPNHLKELYRARAKRRGKDDLESWNVEPEPWESRLRDIRMVMLHQSLDQAAGEHVSRRGYQPLVLGAVDTLLVMLQTEGLARTFPSFDNKEQLELFRQVLLKIRQTLNTPGKKLSAYKIWETLDRIVEVNEQTLNLPEEVIVHEMAEGATNTLDDFSAIIWPEEKDQFSRSTQGKFYGVGIQISRRDGRLLVVTPLPNTPALRAGIKAGDIIAQVNGRDTSTWTLDRAVRKITGPDGTNVALGIERVGEVDLLRIEITRAEIIIESIRGWQQTTDGRWNAWIDPDQQIGYIRLSQFIPQTADDLDAAINRMEAESPIKGLILDLRFNPGGLLSAAVDVADRFVSEGRVVSTVDGNGRSTQDWPAHRHKTHLSFPLVVLINQGSASASEIVAGAIQDSVHGARIIGTRSFGKGSVQDLFPLDHGKAVLKLTTQYYQLPHGRIIHRQPDATEWGIEPDLVVEMTNDQVKEVIEFRQQLDVVHMDKPAPEEAGQPIGPLESMPIDTASGEEAAEEEPPPTHASEILTRGMDPQLEAALLVLKTRLVAQRIALAQKSQPTVVTP